MFSSGDNAIWTIYGQFKFGWWPSWSFLQRGKPVILGQNFKFLVELCMVKMDLEMMFFDVLE